MARTSHRLSNCSRATLRHITPLSPLQTVCTFTAIPVFANHQNSPPPRLTLLVTCSRPTRRQLLEHSGSARSVSTTVVNIKSSLLLLSCSRLCRGVDAGVATQEDPLGSNPRMIYSTFTTHSPATAVLEVVERT